MAVRDLAEFGISRATFFRRYRFDPYFVECWDIRPYLGQLTMDRFRVRAWAARQLGALTPGYLAGSFPTRECRACGGSNPLARRACRRCGAPCGGERDHA